MSLQFQKALPTDAAKLSEIAIASKKNWGYPEEWLELWKAELMLTSDYIERNPVFKIIDKGELIGFYAVIDGVKTELDHLWLLPEKQRKGFGRQAMRHIRKTVASLGKTTFELVAEPNAKGFYEKMGGTAKSSFESKIKGRFLEVYEFSALSEDMIEDAKEQDYCQLLEVWQSAVKATHDFLSAEDFKFFSQIVGSGEVFKAVPVLKTVKLGGKIVAFAGVQGDNLEMLFIHDDFRGKGIGKFLVNFAIEHLGVIKVDVNKQNSQAVEFYKRFGFKPYKETATDGLGKPYPMLYMSL